MAKFKRGKWIGSGGFCEIFEATRVDENDDRELVMKRLKDEYVGDAEIVERFQREVRLQNRLRHPNIMRIVGKSLTSDHPFLVMPRADVDLRDAIADGRSHDWTIETFEKILEALAYAHSDGVIHRDLSPGNVLLKDDEVWVSDFGLGRDLSSSSTRLTETNDGMGTPRYRAPEQWRDLKDTDERVDVFAAGQLLKFMFTGQDPVDGSIRGIPADFVYFVERCTETNRANRFDDAQHALEAWRQARSDSEVVEPSEELEQHVKEWFAADGKARREPILKAHAVLVQNEHDEDLFLEEVPSLPADFVRDYETASPEAFWKVFEIYDEYVSGGLPWDYCDVVAALYWRIWNQTANAALKRRVFQRLLDMGHSHNRFRVGDVVAALIRTANDTATAQMIAAALRDNPSAAKWHWSRVENDKLARPIANAFKALIP